MRPAVRAALDGSDTPPTRPAPAVPTIPRRANLTPGPLHDACAVCRKALRVHERAWEALRTSPDSPLQSDEALLAAANLCEDVTCAQLAVSEAREVAAELRKRRAVT
jgi:hypothetical protein